MARRRFYALTVSIVFASAIVAFALPQCLANPSPGWSIPPDTTFSVESGASGLIWLFILNIVVNLFWISVVLLLLGRYFGRSVGRLSDTPGIFLASIIGSAVIVTMIGAIVDYTLLLKPDIGSSLRYFSFDAGYWALALALIYLSVLACFRAFVEVKLVPSLVSAGAMAAINLVWWLLSWNFGYDVPLLTLIFGGLAVPILLRYLFYWYVDLKAFEPDGTA